MGRRRAKIIGTLGPSSNSVEKIKELIDAGLNVARVNMSHGTHEGHAELISNIREASNLAGREIGILMDLQGPKIRVDKLPENLKLEAGQKWAIGSSKLQSKYPDYKNNFIPTVYENLVSDAHVGAKILFDDGKLIAEAVDKIENDLLVIEVKVGGELKSNKGINLPNVHVTAPSLTEKDEEDLMFGLTQDIDYIALSFVREASDIQKVKFLLHKMKVNVPIVSKIEKPEAVENIDEIIEVTDAIMIARGDMGVEVGNHLVPSIQKNIIDKCNLRGVPVITATQMLESMVENPLPTRAEASDVANAIWDGTDVVMLSGETASGTYPVEAVTMMSDIIKEAEKTPKVRPYLRHVRLNSITSTNMVAASLVAEKTEAKWIVSVTEGGNSCKKIARFRPITPVLGITNSLKVVRKMTLYWGVIPYLMQTETEDLTFLSYEHLKELRLDMGLQNGDRVVITHGDGKYFQHGYSNSIRVETVRDEVEASRKNKDMVQTVEVEQATLHLDTNVCATCGNCISICPHKIFEVDTSNANHTVINEANAKNCTVDFQCVERCPTGAIDIIPKTDHDKC